MRNPARSLRPKTALVAAVTLAITGVALLDANPAAAATVLTVTNPADVATNFGGCGNSSITTGSGLSLREAVCIANNNGTTPVIIDVAAGHYTLTNGELQAGKVSGSNISIVGAGAGSAVIDGNGASRVFDLDPLAGGGVTTSISNVTITNGVDNTVGGAGILAGSAGLLPVDSLTLTGVVVSNNQAGGSAPTNPNLPGAGVSFQGGNLTVSGSTFSGNNSHSSIGSGLFYQSFTAGEHLTVTGSTFSGNQIAANTSSAYQSGGALATISSGTDIVSVSSSTFTNNTATATGSATAVGGGIYAQGGALTVTGSTFTGNTASASGGAIYTQATSSTLHYNRIVGNNAAAASGVGSTVSAGSNNATENWWGCNAGPGSTGCDGASSVTTAPQLSLSTSASPSHVNAASGTSTLTASLLTDSAAGSVSSSNLGAFAGLPVSFADPPGDATVTSTPGAHSVNLSAGTASIDYHANTTLGPDNTTATFDNQSTTVILEVDAAPAITSADHAGFTFGTFDSFTVTTTGYPAAGLSESGALPSGVTFHDNGNGTATISGTASAGGTFPITITANNGVSPNATQNFTLGVTQAPAFTSASTAPFTVGTFGTFTVTTTGVPSAVTITASGSLPSGLTLTDNLDGTATLAGTPAAGTGGSYLLQLTGSNGVSPDATQNLTVNVNQGPSITANPSNQTVAPGTTASFTAAASGAPTPTVQWQVSTDGGASFSNIGGATSTTLSFTAAAGDDGNEYRAVFTNGTGTATTTAATLSVRASPTITSADHTTFAVGSAGMFSVTTTPGVPSATTITETGSLPSGVSFADNGNGTATLAGTPAAGSGGSWSITITASNGVLPDASQSFTLTVTELPSFTSADHTTFSVGSSSPFTVTTVAGYPTATTLTETGSLPSGVSFTDNGNGTATLTGTPASGTDGSYPLTLTATNTAGHTDQAFTLTVSKVAQTITVTSMPPSPAAVGDTYDPVATASSSLTVMYSVDAATTNSACTLSGSRVTFAAVGSCVIDFDQAGDGTYAAAPRVQQTVAVGLVTTGVTVTTSPAATVYGQDVTATATVTAARGTVAGTVQFTVDTTPLGAPVAVTGGTAVSPSLTSGGSPLAPGSHTIGATFTPTDASTYGGSNGSTSLVVSQAATSTTVTVHAHDLSATVTPVAPGTGTPTGTVTFAVGGVPVGTATLSGGTATLTYTVPTGRANTVAAAYNGDTDFAASSVSTTRRDPLITAHVQSSSPRSSYGWYHAAVTVTFTCTPQGAALTTPCPVAVTLTHDGAGQSVSGTIMAADGGAATASVTGIDIDTVRPRVSIAGVRNGATYPSAPRARCSASDTLSGVARCTLTSSVRNGRTTYRATAVDKAGNTATATVTVTVQGYALAGAPFVDGAFTVHVGHAYTLVVQGVSVQPHFYDAAVVPARPTKRDQAFHAAGRNRWTLGVYMQRALRSHPYWYLGVLVGRTMHLVKIRIAP